MSPRPYVAVSEKLILASQALTIASVQQNPTLFPYLSAAQVWDQIKENPEPVDFPAVLFSTEGVSETYEAIDEYNDAVTRPLVCAILDRDDLRDPSRRPVYSGWRESLIRVFRWPPNTNMILAQCPTVTACKVRPGVIVDRSASFLQLMRTGFTLEFRSIEPRGVLAQS